MSEIYKSPTKKAKKTWGLNYYEEQIDFFKTLENASDYMRWVLDNDSGYQKYMKTLKEGE